MIMHIENWKQIPGYEGFYEVSDVGNVRAMCRIFPRRHNKTSALVIYTYMATTIKPWVNKGTDYLMVTLSKMGTKKHYTVHSLVLLSFVGQRQDGFVACHYNGDKRDNRLANLRWDTYSGNVSDTKRHGRQPRGNAVWWTKLTEDSVRSIRSRLRHGEKCSAIARDYNVTQEAIGHIKNNKNWSWLT